MLSVFIYCTGDGHSKALIVAMIIKGCNHADSLKMFYWITLGEYCPSDSVD